MWTTILRRGLAAGAIGGLLAALVGLLGGTQTIDVAESLAHDHDDHGHDDQHAHDHDDHDHAHDEEHAHGHHDERADPLTRGQQKAGFVGGTLLLGLVVGPALAVAHRWSRGRLSGGPWQRSLNLGAVAIGAVVLLPALVMPPTPPGAGDPDTVGLRTAAYLAAIGAGLLLTVAGRWAARRLRSTTWTRAQRQTVVGAGVLVAAALLVAVLPSPADVGTAASELPAELVWRFRLESLAVQTTLWGGTAVVLGLLAERAEASDGARGEHGRVPG